VSAQSVSRVLNSHPVRDATRAVVLQAISDLGYRRNTAARALVTARSSTIGVVMVNSTLFGPTSTLLAVAGAAQEAGLFVSVATLQRADAAGMTDILDGFMDQAVEGVVVIAPRVGLVGVTAGIGKVPIVVVSAGAASMMAVSVDQQAGARAAVGYLADLGHRNIAHLAGPRDWFDARARFRGWRRELRHRGIAEGPLLDGDWSPERGYEVGQALVRGELPDAVFVANDEMALGLLLALGRAGVRVPEDISIVGFDDVPGSAFYSPPLTTVRQDFSTLGSACITALKAAVAGTGTTRRVLIPAQLIVRSSTAPRSES
jgi:DNA-binding LacI/PurR family transcriptional regulator